MQMNPFIVVIAIMMAVMAVLEYLSKAGVI